MCIMYLKEWNKPFPTKEVNKVCWDDNRDGAGYSWYNKDTMMWHTVKGLMTWDAFWERFSADRKKFGLDNRTVIVHYRVGTSGPEVGGATHPFPATETEGVDVNTLEYISKGVFFHNGTIGRGLNGLSDTQIATTTYIQPMVRHIFEDENKADEDLLDILIEILHTNQNRYVITHGEDIRYLGDWVKGENDIPFSNNRFREANTRYVAAQEKEAAQRLYLADLKAKHDDQPRTRWDGDVEAVVIELPEKVASAERFVTEDGLWDWDAWDGRYNSKEEDPIEAVVNTNLEEVHVYGEDGEIAYTVMRDVLDTEEWEQDKDEYEVGESGGTITCLSCKLCMNPPDLVHGECPACGTLLDPDGIMKEQRDYQCPTCSGNMSVEYSLQEGKIKAVSDYCECWDCSCVWGYTQSGSPWVIGYITGATEETERSLVECYDPQAKEA